MKTTIHACAVAMILAALYVQSAMAGTLAVPADYSTIQDAIDASVAGDVVLVQPGAYVASPSPGRTSPWPHDFGSPAI